MLTLKDCEENKDSLQSAILQTVSQGDDALERHLSPFVDSVWCVHGLTRHSCDIKYLLTQRDLISMAMGYARNMVDVSSTKGNSDSNTHRRTDSERSSHSQRKGHAISCSWSTATSFRTFARDSSSNDQSKSHAEASSSGAFSRNSNSSSNRGSLAWSYGISSADTDVNGINQMQGIQTHSRGATNNSTNFKRNASASTDTQISAPLIGTIRFRIGFSGVGDWGNKSDAFSEDHVNGKTDSTANTIATSTSHTDDSAASSSFAKAQSDASGTSSQYGSSSALAQAAGIATSHAEAHSGSENTSHSEGEQASEMQAESEYLTTGKTKQSSNENLETSGSRWGQIFDSLKSMFDETVRQIDEMIKANALNNIPLLSKMEGLECSPFELIKMRRNPSPYFRRIGR